MKISKLPEEVIPSLEPRSSLWFQGHLFSTVLTGIRLIVNYSAGNLQRIDTVILLQTCRDLKTQCNS